MEWGHSSTKNLIPRPLPPGGEGLAVILDRDWVPDTDSVYKQSSTY